MKTVELRSNLHQLIDTIQDDSLLESLFEFLNENQNTQPGKLWNDLSQAQRQEILDAYEESENEENLSHILKYSKV